MRGRRVWVRGESGQAMPVAVVIIVLVAVLTIAFGSMAGDVIDAARAQTAADAAALASIEGGRAAAGDLAGRHGATVVSWYRQGVVVEVAVRVGDAVAVARATGGPPGP